MTKIQNIIRQYQVDMTLGSFKRKNAILALSTGCKVWGSNSATIPSWQNVIRKSQTNLHSINLIGGRLGSDNVGCLILNYFGYVFKCRHKSSFFLTPPTHFFWVAEYNNPVCQAFATHFNF